MSHKFSMVKRIAVTTALVAGVAGVAYADDNSMNPYNGDSYAYFNGGNLPQGGKPVIATAPSTFRETNPHGLPFSSYAALSSPIAPEWQPAPVLDRTASTFHRDNPHGLPFSTYAALSSVGPEYPSPDQAAFNNVATNEAPVMSAPREPLGTRLARFFHFPHAEQSSEN